MAMIKFYYSPGSCAVAAHILLVDSGLEHQAISVDVRSGQPWPEDLARLNPKRQVPFLEIEPGYILTENIAIQSYITQAVPEKQYLGRSDREVLRSYEWLAFLSGPLHAASYGSYFRPQRFSDDAAVIPGIKAKGKSRIRECYEYIESRIDERGPVERIQAVDAYLLVFFRWGNSINIDMKCDFPKYHARMIQFVQLESVKKAAANEGIKLLVDESV